MNQSSHQTVLDQLAALVTLPVTGWKRASGDGIAHAESEALDDSGWQPIEMGERTPAAATWLRTWVEIPGQIHGYRVSGARAVLRLRIGWNAPVLIYLNGMLVQNEPVEPEPLVISERAVAGQRALVAIRVLSPSKLDLAELEFHPSTRPDPLLVRQEIEIADLLNAGIRDRGSAERDRAIAAALAAVDLAALDRGDQEGFDRSLGAARAHLLPLREWEQRYAILATANSHIDMAWLWPATETVEVVRRTFGTALQLMREYPDLTFTMASAQSFAWMQDLYPALFAQIKERVQQGRWEIVGGMWVEPDLNLPDGESLARQLLYGKRYFRQQLGVDVKIGWNPDSFGYCWQLPQIYKRAGVDYFVTQKLYWNDTTKFQHQLFWWQAPDSSKLLAYFPHDYGNDTRPTKMASDLAAYAPATGSREMMHLFGIGDHGGGPTRAMLDVLRAWQHQERVFPRLDLGTAGQFFARLERDLAQLDVPTWNDELYLEFHRGVQTSQSEAKKDNRESEALLLTAERFASLVSLFGGDYPQRDLELAWKKVLFNQFHDILPGSSIAAVYREAAQDHAEVRRIAGGALSASLQEIAQDIDTNGSGVPVVVFNPLSWQRSEVVELEVRLPRAASSVQVLDTVGRPAPAQLLAADPARRAVRLRLLAEDVASLGYQSYRVVPGPAAAQPPLVTATDYTLENACLRVEVDPRSGCIRSLFDKRAQRESVAAGGCGNLLQAFVDLPRQWDAWNIDATFEDRRWDLLAAESVQPLERGPLRASIRVVKRFKSSTIVQDITLDAGAARVDVISDVDWHEQHVLLKAAFSVDVQSERATFEIPYGTIERPTTRRTPAERARFEVPALRWADLSDAQFGLSVLNASKHGYDVKGNAIRLSLLRSPGYPDLTEPWLVHPDLDAAAASEQGRHRFTYAFYPHAGGWREGGAMRAGYQLNYRLIALPVDSHDGVLPPQGSFVDVTPDNVIVTALKRAEDGDAYVLRCYEYLGRAAVARIRLPRPVASASEVNLIEDPVAACDATGDSIAFEIGPHEIRSFKVAFARR
ncbi:MAG: alpha-mannosidase [Deltaproteobacteria bacterium]|nr:alpha-mannosidase [Deltaproteobacteria bacterium]